MPVQINEIVIRAVVDEHERGDPAAGSSPAPGSAGPEPDPAIVEQVLELLRSKNER